MGLLDAVDTFDPRTQGLLAAAFQGLQASGPSRMPVSLGQIIGQGGTAGMTQYAAAQKSQQQAALMELEKQKALREANAMKLDAQMRSELSTAKTPEEQLAIARKYMKADTLGTSITTSLDRQTQQKATNEMALARLNQSLQTAQNTHELRLRGLTNGEDRAKEIARHNSVVESLQSQATQQAGQRLFYDTGLTAGGPALGSTPAPSGGLLSPPPGFKTVESLSLGGQAPDASGPAGPPGPITNPAEQAAAQMVIQADAQGKPMSVGVPSAPPVRGLIPPVANAAPVAPTSIIPPAPPNNLDARDLALGVRPPVVPTVAAPVVTAPVVPAAPVVSPTVKTMPVMPPEIARAPKSVQNKWLLQQTSANAGGADLMTPEAITNAAIRYNAFQTLPPLGMKNAEIRAAILNKAASLATEAGQSGTDLNITAVTNKANAVAMSQLQKQATMVGAFERTFNKNADLALEYSTKVDNSGVPIVTKWINAGKRAVTGDPQLSAYDAIIKGVANEYTKIISGSMGNMQMAEQEIKRVETLLTAAQTPAQVSDVIGMMKKETQNRMSGFAEEKAKLRDSMKAVQTPKFGTDAAPSVPAIRKYNPATGKIE